MRNCSLALLALLAACDNTGPAAPPAPTGLAAAAGDGQVVLTWNPVVEITGYNVYRAEGASVAVTAANRLNSAPLTANGYTDTAVTNGAHYTYVVTALRSTREGAASAPAGATPAAPQAAGPANVVATAGDGSIKVNWDAVAGATSYDLYYSTTSGAGLSGNKLSPVSPGVTINGLVNGTTYYIVVTAVGAGGESAPSAEASATPHAAPVVVPAAPANVVAVAGDASISVTWDAVSGATSYDLYWSATDGAGTSGTRVSGVSAGAVVGGLTNGTTYYVVVTALNSAGESAPSAQASATPMLVAPQTAPTGLALVPGNHQLTVNFDAVAGATSYNVYYSTASGQEMGGVEQQNMHPGDALQDLDNGTTYYAVVTAVNGAGEGPASAEASGTPAQPPPATPTGLTAVPDVTSVTLHWTPGANDDGENVYQSTAPFTGTTGSPTGAGGASTEIFGLAPATTYYFSVTGVNSSGESAATSVISTTTLAAPPAIVTAVPGDGQVTITWTDSTGATGYDLYWSSTPGGAAAGTKVPSVSSGATVSGLTDGTPYYFAVVAVDAGGAGPASSEATATPAIVPGLTAIAGNGKVSLSWQPVAGASSYNIYRGTATGAETLLTANATTSYADTAVVNYTDYFYVVTAVVSGSETAPSLEVSGTPVKWIAVSIASAHALGVTDDGRLWTWGKGSQGQLGLGSVMLGPVAHPTVLSSATNWTAVSAGGWASHAIAGGVLYSWGYDGNFGGVGCLGLGAFENHPFFTPTQVGSKSDWTEVVTNDGPNLCIGLGGDSSSRVWNWSDLVGVSPQSTQIVSAPQQTASGLSHLALSNYATTEAYGITSGGALYSWGYDGGRGALGQGQVFTYVSSPGQVGSATNWTDVAAGDDIAAGIAGGALFAWGYWGQTSLLGTTEGSGIYSTPTQVGSATNWTAVRIGTNAHFAIAGGALYAWGSDGLADTSWRLGGQLGLGPGRVAPVNTPTQIGSATNWASVAVIRSYGSQDPFAYATLALDTDGNLFSWGYEAGTGVLGLGAGVPVQYTPAQVSVP